MTTDAELKERLKDKTRSYPRDWIFSAYLETPERRTILAKNLMPVWQHRLDFAITKRRRWVESSIPGYSVRTAVGEMKRLVDACDGTETLDRTRLLSLYSDLRALCDEQSEVYSKAGASDD